LQAPSVIDGSAVVASSGSHGRRTGTIGFDGEQSCAACSGRDRIATHSAVSTLAADDCIARMMRKANRAMLISDAALLLLWGIGLLVSRERNGRLVQSRSDPSWSEKRLKSRLVLAALRQALRREATTSSPKRTSLDVAPSNDLNDSFSVGGRTSWGCPSSD
jgi:hypothetical protein